MPGKWHITSLVTAVDAAGLKGTLEGDGPFTVFTVTDEAFAALGEETINALLADPKGDLTAILTYHVVGDSLSINQVAPSDYIPTLEGWALKASNDGGPLMVNNANTALYNIKASNGVIHVIDTVMVP